MGIPQVEPFHWPSAPHPSKPPLPGKLPGWVPLKERFKIFVLFFLSLFLPFFFFQRQFTMNMGFIFDCKQCRLPPALRHETVRAATAGYFDSKNVLLFSFASLQGYVCLLIWNHVTDLRNCGDRWAQRVCAWGANFLSGSIMLDDGGDLERGPFSRR